MKSLINFIFIYLVLFLFINPVFAIDVCKTPWRIGVSDRFPFESYVKDEPSGLNVDIIKEVAKKLKCKIEFSNIPFTRIINEAKSGKIDIIMGVGRRKEREEFAYYLSPYLNKPSVLITLKENKSKFKNFSLQDVNKKDFLYSIGAVLGFVYSKEYERLLTEPDFSRHLAFGTKNDLNLMKLSAKRIDAMLASDIIIAKRLIENSNNMKIYTIIPIDKEDFAYFLYTKSSFSIDQAKVIDIELQKVLNSSLMDKFMLNYFKEDEINLIKVKSN